jgi:hypothetical protein
MSASGFPGRRVEWYRAGMIATTDEVYHGERHGERWHSYHVVHVDDADGAAVGAAEREVRDVDAVRPRTVPTSPMTPG